MNTSKKLILMMTSLLFIFGLTACATHSPEHPKNKQLVIYTNADTEAVNIMKKTLDSNGFKGGYKFQEFGSSDLNAKLIAEGSNISSDIITLSTFYIDSAQNSSQVFAEWNTPSNVINSRSTYQSPILGNEGAIIVNTDTLKQANLPMPKSIKDLANPIYKDQLSFPSLEGSTTGWLMVQALIQTYGKNEAENILSGMIRNAGSMMTNSGSAPVQNIESGQVAVSYGLRVQGEKATTKMPVSIVDPTEGNFVLTESVAVLQHEKIKPEAKKAAEILSTKTRSEMIDQYPIALFNNEEKPSLKSDRVKFFDQTLTTDLLKEHINLFNTAKAKSNT